MVGTSEGGGQRDRREGTEEEEVTGEGEENVRGGREGTGREGMKGRRRGKEVEGNLIPTVISKSRRLWLGLQLQLHIRHLYSPPPP